MAHDLVLTAAVLAGPSDESMFESLVTSHQKRVFAIALRMLGDPDEAATATQECFLRAFRAWRKCPGDERGQRRWLARLATNLCLDRLRSRRWRWWRERLDLDTAGSEGIPHSGTRVRSPERELLAREAAGRLQQALARLSPRQRAVFVLRHYEDLPLDDIAAALGMNVGTVKSHLSRALVALRHELKDLYDPRSSV